VTEREKRMRKIVKIERESERESERRYRKKNKQTKKDRGERSQNRTEE
jgi:hypothetical protein